MMLQLRKKFQWKQFWRALAALWASVINCSFAIFAAFRAWPNDDWMLVSSCCATFTLWVASWIVALLVTASVWISAVSLIRLVSCLALFCSHWLLRDMSCPDWPCSWTMGSLIISLTPLISLVGDDSVAVASMDKILKFNSSARLATNAGTDSDGAEWSCTKNTSGTAVRRYLSPEYGRTKIIYCIYLSGHPRRLISRLINYIVLLASVQPSIRAMERTVSNQHVSMAMRTTNKSLLVQMKYMFTRWSHQHSTSTCNIHTEIKRLN